jgi:hypothetical protein
MQDFADMAEAHEWTVRRLREMAGRLTEQAYLRASAAAGQDDEAHARWMLVFDRMARGLRLSIALEARLARERRADARELERELEREIERGAEAGIDGADAARAASPARDAEPAEADCERDDDGLPDTAPLSRRIDRIKAIVEGAGAPEILPRPARAERHALAFQRAERARLAAGVRPPDEPWDVLDPADLADLADLDFAAHDEPPWRGSG